MNSLVVSLLVSVVGALGGAMLAVMFSVRVFGISGGWMYVVFIFALAILGARLARMIYKKASRE